MNYVNAVDFQFKNSDKVIIRARGKFISRAVDVSQVMKNRYDSKIEDIKIDSEEFEDKEKGKTIRVSNVDITLAK